MPPNDLKRIRFFVMARLRPGHPRLSCCYAVKTWMAGTSPAMTMKSIAAPHYEEGISKMTARGGQTLFVAINLFAFFVALLRFHRQRRDRAGFQPLQRDRLAGLLAIAVGVVVDALQRRVDLGDQLALPVAGAQFDRAVGLGRCAIGEIGMIDVLFLQGLQGDPRFAQDLVLPRQELGTKIIALAIVHERLFFGGSIAFQLFQVQPVCDARRSEKRRPRAPYIAVCCDRQYRLQPGNATARRFPGRNPWRSPKEAQRIAQSNAQGLLKGSPKGCQNDPAQNCPALASSTSTRSSISDSTESRPGSPEEDFRLAAASRNRLIVEASKLPDNSAILRSSSTSSAPLPRCTERLRRSAGSSSMPCKASSASMLAAALGATATRLSWVAAASSGSEKPVELVFRTLAEGVPSVVPLGP